MSSWVALKERANFTVGETVLVNGATGTSGRLALQVAKYLGAKKVIATGRQAATLQSIKALGADETILLVENRDALENAFKEQFAGGVDIVLDYLWGPSTESLLIAGSRAGTDAPIRFIQIGTASGAKITLSGAILRSTPMELKGSGSAAYRLIALSGGSKKCCMQLSQIALKWRSNPFRYPKSNGFGWPTPICPASCSRLARNVGNFRQSLHLDLERAPICQIILLRNRSAGKLSTEKEILP